MYDKYTFGYKAKQIMIMVRGYMISGFKGPVCKKSWF